MIIDHETPAEHDQPSSKGARDRPKPVVAFATTDPNGSLDRPKKIDRSRLFTELSVSRIKIKPSEKGQITYRDKKGNGLLLRLNTSGAKSWVVSFYDDGRKKMRSEKLGDYLPGSPDHMSVKAARDAAANFRSNKRAILEDRANKGTHSDSFEDVAEKYLKRFVDGKRRSAAQIRKMVEKLYPVWGSKPFEGIRRSDITHVLDDIEENRGPRTADITLAILRRMMGKYAIAHDDYSSPIRQGMARIENPSERARDRILSDQEIRIMWTACEDLGTFGNLAKMLLLTAQRRIKVATMRWDDLNGDVWTIATEKREKGNAERLKLPKPALAIIATQRELRINEFVFPCGRGVTKRNKPGQFFGSFSAFGQNKHALDVARGKLEGFDVPGLDTKAYATFKSTPEFEKWNWTLHDLRSTARSLMSRAKVRPDIAERVLGHKIGGVQGVYDRHVYDTERATALVALSALIGRILEGKLSGNVVPISR